MILMNCEIIASGLPYSEPPSFKIGEKIRLETILSCGTGAFQNKQDSVFWCDSMKEGEKLLFLERQILRHISSFAINKALF